MKSDLTDLLKSNNDLQSLLVNSAFDKLMFQKREEDETRIGMHGSGVISKDFCYRQQVLSFYYKGAEPNYPVELRRIFLNGWYVHIKWQKLFEQAKIAYGIEQRGKSDFWKLLFTPDAIIKLKNKLYIVEIKSVNTIQFQKMNEHESARHQIQLYMHMTGIPNGIVLCEDKNTQRIKTYIYQYNFEEVLPYLERMEKVKKYLGAYEKDKMLPKRICQSENNKCAENCAYKNACFGKGELL